MIEFRGVISEDVRKKEIGNQTKSLRFKMLTGAIVSFFALLIVVVFKYLMLEEKPSFVELFKGKVSFFLLIIFVIFLVFFIVTFFRPFYNKELDKKDAFSVSLDNDKIVYSPESGFGKREINYSNLKKIIDEGSFYVLVGKEHNIRFICEKDLLVQGSLKEFDEYFDKIIDRKVESSFNDKVKDVKVENLGVEEEIKTENPNGEAANNVESTKTFSNEKFKKSKNKNEKSFKFAIIGVILGLVSVALTPIIVIYGINFAVGAISAIFNNLFYGGFVIEFFTFVLACMFVLLAALLLFPACVLITPIMALLSLIFPIYQLVVVNRRWFSWVALAIGILSIGGCFVVAFLTIQGL